MKTLEESAKECAWHAIGNQDHFTSEQIFKYGAYFAMRWIPVNEELPNNFSSVLVRDDSSSPLRSVALFEDGKFYPDFKVLNHEKVTHWRPLEIP